MRSFRKALSLLMVLSLLVGLFVFTAFAEGETDCANGKHTPGEFHEAAYTPCFGGFKTDYYTCSDCGCFCDGDGNQVFRDNGTGVHTPGEIHPADYLPCQGGYKTDYYTCSYCGCFCDESGNQVFRESGTGVHRPGKMYPADYTECGGGFKTAYHICTVCGNPCDENGNDSWDHAFKHHTPLTIPAKAATVDAEGNIEYVKCTVCGNTFKNVEDAQDDIRCSMKDVTLPKLPAEDKPAETTPPEETTPPDENEPGHKVEIDDNVTEVPDSISDKYESVESMSQEMLLIVMDHDPMFHNSNAGLVKTKLIEVSLMVETENGWEPATEANFPAEGVTVTLPYPKGVGRHNHVFSIAHMITTGERAGEVEIVPCTATKDGLRATFHSLSPVMIVYREKTADELIAPLPGGAAKTGDEGMVGLWMAVMAVSAAGVVLLISKKSRASKR